MLSILSLVQLIIDFVLFSVNATLFIYFLRLIKGNQDFVSMKVPVTTYFSIILTLQLLTVVGYSVFVVWVTWLLYEGN